MGFPRHKRTCVTLWVICILGANVWNYWNKDFLFIFSNFKHHLKRPFLYKKNVFFCSFAWRIEDFAKSQKFWKKRFLTISETFAPSNEHKVKNDPFLEFRHCNVAKNMSNFHESIGGTLDVFVDFEGFGKSTIFLPIWGRQTKLCDQKRRESQ